MSLLSSLTLNERKPWFHTFFQKQLALISDSLKDFRNSDDRNKVAVIVEPRQHEFSEGVIGNILLNLNFINPKNTWNLHIITSHASHSFYKTLYPGAKITLLPEGKDNLTLEDYSALLLSEAFWANIREEHILIFQSDTMMFRPLSGQEEEEWLSYAYVGANFFNPHDQSAFNGGNNGGFSLRRRSAMLDCLNHITYEEFKQYRKLHNKLTPVPLHEDVFFSTACEMRGHPLCDINRRPQFSVEDACKPSERVCLSLPNYKNPIGCHRFLSNEMSADNFIQRLIED